MAATRREVVVLGSHARLASDHLAAMNRIVGRRDTPIELLGLRPLLADAVRAVDALVVELATIRAEIDNHPVEQ
jgi:hypothetical protein